MPANETVVAAPSAMTRYFHELVAGGVWLVGAIITVLGMLYLVLFQGDELVLRLFYFLVIAVSVGVMMLGIKIIMDSEAERALANRVKDREFVIDDAGVHISIALVEGAWRLPMRKEKIAALDIRLDEIVRFGFDQGGTKPPVPCLVLHLSRSDALRLMQPLDIHIQRSFLEKDEAMLLEHLVQRGVVVEGSLLAANPTPPSSQSDGSAPLT